jgi:O-antigen/teichoic acid export membrane protein
LQNQPERFCAYYQKAMSLLATAVMPLVAFVFVTADPLVLVGLGPQGIDAAVIFRVLAPAALIVTFNSATGWVYAALGRTDRQIRWVTYSSLLRIAAVSVGVMWGTVGVAAATTLSVCSLWLPGVLYCFAESPLRLHHLLIALWRPALASLAATAILATAQSLRALQGTAMVELLLGSAVFGLAYVAAWLAMPGGRTAVSEIVRLATELRRHRQESPQGRQVADVEPYVKPALSR